MQGVVTSLQSRYAVHQTLYLISEVSPLTHALQTVVNAWIFFNCCCHCLQLLLGNVLLLKSIEHELQLSIVVFEGFLDLHEFCCFLFESFEVFALLHHHLLPALGVELLDSHVCGSFSAWLQQGLIKCLFVGDESSLIVNFLLILHQSFAAHLRFFLFDLFSDEKLQSQVSALLEEVFYGFELTLALREGSL